jgi:hypothetical protein
MFTGTLPHQHGLHRQNRNFSSIDQAETFLTDLPETYKTIGISANVHLGPAFGFDNLFDTFLTVSPQVIYRDGLDAREFLAESSETGFEQIQEYLSKIIYHSSPIKSLINGVAKAIEYIVIKSPLPRLWDDGAKRAMSKAVTQSKEADEPFFMFINLMDAHTPHAPTRGYNRTLHSVPYSWSSESFDFWDVRGKNAAEAVDVKYFKQLYSASIEYMDRVVGSYIQQIRKVTERETTVILTSDHGEELGEGDKLSHFGHVGSLSEALLHVPLLIFNPPSDGLVNGRKYVTHLDMGKLITGLATGSVPDISRNKIASEVVGGSVQQKNVSSDNIGTEYWNRMIRCSYYNDRKVEWDSLGSMSEYRVCNQQPSTQKQLRTGGSVPRWAREFFTEDIHSYKRRIEEMESSPSNVVNEAVKSRLDELGYR